MKHLGEFKLDNIYGNPSVIVDLYVLGNIKFDKLGEPVYSIMFKYKDGTLGPVGKFEWNGRFDNGHWLPPYPEITRGNKTLQSIFDYDFRKSICNAIEKLKEEEQFQNKLTTKGKELGDLYNNL
jgi:hypothetical protein